MNAQELKYPFEFDECLLTGELLTFLGFGEYWDKNGTSGTRTLNLGEAIPFYKIWYVEEMEDGNEGYGDTKEYCPAKFFSADHNSNLYFLHDLYEDIKATLGNSGLQTFRELCFSKNLKRAIESYENYLKTVSTDS